MENVRPRLSYVICAVQRSGSFLLCEALRNTGVAGFPEEYFHDGEGWEDGAWERQHGVVSLREYLDLVVENGTSANGVFGTKNMWNYFDATLTRLRRLPGCQGPDAPALMAASFPNVHYIWITRRDKVRQAISWARAGQTDVYAWHKGETPVPKREPTFDFAFIDQLHSLVLEGEAGWQDFFAAARVQPCRVEYKELVVAYETTALRVLDFLNIPYPEHLIFGERRLLRQADALNDRWVEQYTQMKPAEHGG